MLTAESRHAPHLSNPRNHGPAEDLTRKIQFAGMIGLENGHVSASPNSKE